MRRKLVFLAFLLAATVTASRAQADLKNVCWSCAYCFGGVCYDCVQIICPP